MDHELPVASGDQALFAMLGGVLLLALTALGLAIAGGCLALGRNLDRRRLGRRLLLLALIPIAAGAVWWTAFVGLD